MRSLLIGLLLVPVFANAGGFLRPAFSYTIDKDESNGTTENKTRRMIDLGAGYISEKGITALGQYSLEKKKTVTSSSTSTTTTNSDRTSMGVGGGWTSRKDTGAYAHAIYYLSSEDIVTGTTYKGKGYEMDLGLKVSIQKISIAFQLAYRAFKYTESTTGTTTTALTQPRKQTNLDPAVALFVEF